MKEDNTGQEKSPSQLIDERIAELKDWRGDTLRHIRALIKEADPSITEEWKWVTPSKPGTPVWSHGGLICTGESYKDHVKLTFAKGASLKDPKGLFNQDGTVRRAIDIYQGDKIDESAFKDLVTAAVNLNLSAKKK
jgi:hypothetical protein